MLAINHCTIHTGGNNLIYIISGAIVPVEQFDNHVKKMHNDRDQPFENEYAVSCNTTIIAIYLKLLLLQICDLYLTIVDQ